MWRNSRWGRLVKNIRDLYKYHIGEDIWIVAAGPSAGHVDPLFFNNKTTIGINWTFRWFPVDFVVAKENYVAQAAIQHSAARVVYSRFSAGNYNAEETEIDHPRAYWFDHAHNKLKEVDLSPIGYEGEIPSPPWLVVSYSTITSAMHLAAFMGAANIILVGHDCGTIDGELNVPDYPVSPIGDGDEFYKTFIKEIEPQTIAVRDRIREVYRCNTYSLNPWINFGLEGHRYER